MSARSLRFVSSLTVVALTQGCVTLAGFNPGSDKGDDTDVVAVDDTDVVGVEDTDLAGETAAPQDTDVAPDTDLPADTDPLPDTDPPVDTDPPAPGLYLFVTDAGSVGNLGGVSGADARCNASPVKPVGSGTFKAMLADDNTRHACTTSLCVTGGAWENLNWVLQPSTTYFRPDGTQIGSTTAAGIFTSVTVGIGTNNSEVWTGLAYDWTNSSNSSNCTNWTDGTGNTLGNVGLADETGTDLIARYLQYCDRSNVLIYCAEQP